MFLCYGVLELFLSARIPSLSAILNFSPCVLLGLRKVVLHMSLLTGIDLPVHALNNSMPIEPLCHTLFPKSLVEDIGHGYLVRYCLLLL